MLNFKDETTIYYPVPETFPDPRARFIQIINTALAIANKGYKIKLLIGKRRGVTVEDMLEFYGLDPHHNLEIVLLPMLRRENASFLRVSWHGVFNIFLLIYLFRLRKDAGVIILRHLKLARLLLRCNKVLQTPLLFEVHEIFHLSIKDSEKVNKLKRLEERVYGHVNGLFVLTEQLKQCLKELLSITETPIFFIPHAVKGEWFKEINSFDHGKYICYAGSLYPWKGVDCIIRAMKYLPGEILYIIGGGTRLEEIKNLAKKEGVEERVRFLGRMPHDAVRDYLLKAKVAVLPNTKEGPSSVSSPLKLFEYMACGLPIVASDLPGFREILTHGKNALLFEPESPKALADRIQALFNKPSFARKIAAQARRDVEAFTYDKRAERIVAAIKEILRNSV
ncbi:MAG: glycosyltransferase family 4 protein [Thermodesulfobacteriota bacterium]